MMCFKCVNTLFCFHQIEIKQTHSFCVSNVKGKKISFFESKKFENLIYGLKINTLKINPPEKVFHNGFDDKKNFDDNPKPLK